MSVDLNVFLDPSRMVTPPEWAQAVRGAGFDVEMDTEFDPSTHSGFLPCKYEGKDAGFEYFFQVLEGAELEKSGIGDPSRPARITFSTHSDLREFASSLICAAVLCSVVDGVLEDTDGGTRIPSASAVAWARDGEREIQGDIEKQDRRARTTSSRPPSRS